jgi:dTDP-N-acetylfucosamine:lipid II N-acetylfucosaminyltransferase
MKIAHLFPDSPFLSFTADAFETVAPGTNTFLVYALRGDVARHGLPATATVQTVVNDARGLDEASSVVAGSDIAIFHSVGAFGARALAAAPSRTLKVWSGWGGDYYGSGLSGATGLLGPQSARYYRLSRTLPGKVQRTYRHVKSSLPLGAAARAADVFSAPIPNDLAVFKSRFRGFRGRYSQLNYASVEDTFASSAPVTGDDILLGNSATVQNNHFEALELIAQTGTAGRRVVVPLSYGDAAYADAVVARGSELLGSDFMPLREFMPLEDYQQVVGACSVVVMGHRRQQGIGNVAAALWSGAHVFLDERNPLSAFLRDRGAFVGTLGALAANGMPTARVTGDEREENRRVLREFWGRDTVLANIEALIASR